MKRILLIAIGFGCHACITPVELNGFQGFPKKFTAQQELGIDVNGKTQNLIAQLTRDHQTFAVTFFEPALQTPVLSISRQPDRPLAVDLQGSGMRADVDPERIMHSITELYESSDLQPVSTEPSEWRMNRKEARYTLNEMHDFAGCTFPKSITIEFLTPEGQVAARLRIHTSELSCLP